MPDAIGRIREIAPCRSNNSFAALESRLEEMDPRHVTVRTASEVLGRLNMGGSQDVVVLVEEDGLSRPSGCLFYVALEVIPQEVLTTGQLAD